MFKLNINPSIKVIFSKRYDFPRGEYPIRPEEGVLIASFIPPLVWAAKPLGLGALPEVAVIF